MAKCLNCSKTITCGCQKRKAKDGKEVCSSCVVSYEAKLSQPTVKPSPMFKPYGPDRYK